MQTLRDYLDEKIPTFDKVVVKYTKNGKTTVTIRDDPNMDKEASNYILETEELYASLDGVDATEIETAFFKNEKLIYRITMDEFVTLLCDLEDEDEEE